LLDSIIVGAGLAGLTAAHRLKQAGARVRVFEAQLRAGGRVRTVGIPEFATHVDLGGEWVGSYHHSIRALCKELNVVLTEDKVDGLQLLPTHVRLDGRNLEPIEVDQLSQEISKVIDDLIRLSMTVDPIAPWNAPSQIALLTSVSVDSWLREQGFSRHLREVFSDLAPDSQSMLALLALVAGGHGAPFFHESEVCTVAGGASKLVSALFESVPDSLELGVSCRRIKQLNDGSVLVELLNEDGTRLDYVARTVIVAIPFSCLESIEGLPGLPIKHHPSMCRNQKMTLMAAVDPPASVQPCTILTDQACRIIQSKFLDFRGCAPYIRVDIFVRPPTDSNTFLDRGALSEALILCGIAPSALTAVIQSDWVNLPWSRGSYSVLGPNVLTPNYGLALRGLPPVFFAGDYVVPGFAGYMEGAVMSGNVAAARVGEYLGLAVGQHSVTEP
jgi:monoamine oxidase